MSSLRKYTFIIGAAGGGDDLRTLDVDGPVLAVLEASATFQISCDGEAPIPCERGLKFRREFHQIQLQNLSAAQNSVTLLIGDGEVEDYRPQAKAQIASSGKTLWGTTYTGTTPATAQLVSAAENDRVEVVILAAATNTQQVVISSAPLGFRIIAIVNPGQYYRLNYKGELYIYGLNPTVDTAQIWATYY